MGEEYKKMTEKVSNYLQAQFKIKDNNYIVFFIKMNICFLLLPGNN